MSAVLDRSRVNRVAGTLIGPAAVLIILLAGPYVLPPGLLDVGALCALYAIAAVGLNVLMGYTGQVSFGQGAFWAIGAYSVGILTVRLDMSALAAIPLALVITGVAAFLIGWPVTQLRGHYLAVATLALAFITVDLANNLESLTGGNAGLPGVPSLVLFGEPVVGVWFYRLCWGVAIVVLVLAANLSASRSGRALRAVGADESGSQALGVASGAYRSKAFVFAAVLAGLSGALYATYLGFLSPEAFAVNLSALLLIVIVVGGLASPYGAVVGAVVVTALTHWLTQLATSPDVPARVAPALNTLFYGAVIFLVMRLHPAGLLPLMVTVGRRVGQLATHMLDRRGRRSPAADSTAEVVEEHNLSEAVQQKSNM
jgi:branched-chain amino acid transport system permease protein